MQVAIAVTEPFSFAQTLRFARRFPPLERVAIVSDDSLTAALASRGRGWAFTLRAAPNGSGLIADVAANAPRDLAPRIADFIGAADELGAFYAAAAGDPAFAPLVERQRGLHHVRFLGIEEIAAYAAMMQRTPIALAARMKRMFLDAFGHRVDVAGHTLRAMPELHELAELDEAEIADAIGSPAKAARIVEIVRGVAAIGEPFLRAAPYADARAALLGVRGIGPFSANAILMRGLGRMDDLPIAMFEREGRAVYGACWSERAIAARYAGAIGYWAYYLKAGARTPARSAPQPRRVGLSSAHG